MRPFKDTIPMKNWSKSQLVEVLNDRNSPEKVKAQVLKIFEDRQTEGYKFLEKFFNHSTNKFWNLAKWQLYREGKAQKYGVGEHARFYVDDPVLIFDKMVEIQKAWDKYRTGKKINELTPEANLVGV